MTSAAIAASTLLFAAPALAQSVNGNPATADGTGEVIILSPISFIDIDPVDFGTVIVPAAGNGTATIDALTGVATYSNLDYVTLTGLPQRGRFIGSGSANQTVYITTTLPTQLVQSPGVTVPVALELDRAADISGNYVYTVDPTSLTFEVGVGGTVTVPTGTTVGNYSATYQVTATYQ